MLAARIRGSGSIAPADLIIGSASIAPITGSVEIDTTFDVTVDSSIAVGLAIYVNGNEIDRDRIMSLTVSKSLDQTIQKWTLVLAMSGPGGYYFRSPFSTYAPSIGRDDVLIVQRLRKGSRILNRPIISRGVARSWSVQYPLETIIGDDAAGRIDSRLISIVLAAGSGITRRQLIIMVVGMVGETSTRLEGEGGTLVNPSDNLDQDALNFCANEAAAIGRVLLYDEFGHLTWVKIGTANAFPSVEINRAHFLSLSASGPQSIITDITLTGSVAVITPPAPVDDAVKTSVPIKTEIKDDFALPTAVYLQASDCSSSIATSAPDAREQLRSITLTWQSTKQGTVISEVSEEYGWLLEEVARYQQGSLDRECIPGVYLLDTSDTAPAFVSPWACWSLLRRITTYHYWDADGFRRASPDISQPWGSKLSAGSGSKLKMGTITETEEWYHVRKAIKALIPGTPWESTPVSVGLKMLGSGEGIVASPQSFGIVNRIVSVIESDSGFTRSIKTYNIRFSHYPGGAFLFSDQTTGASETEILLISSRAEVSYRPIGTTFFETVSRTIDTLSPLEKLIGDETSVLAAGAGPATERIPEANLTAGDAGSSTGTQLIKARVVATGLEVWAGKREVKTQSQGAESQQEIEAEARERIEESAAIAIQCELLPGMYISPGAVVALTDGETGLSNRKAQAHRTEFAMTGSLKLTAQFNVYPEE